MKNFLKNPYGKGGALIVVCGAILILFNNWVSKATITIGFAKINSVLTPVYIGIILAVLMCPIYNGMVGKLYNWFNKQDEKPVDAISNNAIIPSHVRQRMAQPADLRRRRNLKSARRIASIGSLTIVIGVIALLLYFVVPQLLTTSRMLLQTAPQKLNMLTAWMTKHLSKYPELAQKLDRMTNVGFNELMTWLNNAVSTEKATALATTLSNGIISFVGAIFNAFIGVLIMLYLLNYKDKLFAITRKLVAANFKKKTAENLFELVNVINTTFIGFMVGRIIDSAIIGVLTFACMCIFGFPYAAMISVVIGVTNIIPFFGPFIGAIPTAIIILAEKPSLVIWYILMILVIQQLDGNVIGPKVVGNAIGIESFWVLISVLIGGGLFGFAGMIFSVPIFAVVYRYVDKLTSRKLNTLDRSDDTDSYYSLEEYGIDTTEVELKGTPPSRMSLRGMRKSNTAGDSGDK